MGHGDGLSSVFMGGVLGLHHHWWGVVLGLLCHRQVAWSLHCICSCHRLLVGQVRWVGRGGTYCWVMKKMTVNDESVIVHHLVAMSLSATWHLDSMCKKQGGTGMG